jgi:hypothetical protein
MSDVSQEKTSTGQVPPQTRGKERSAGAHAARPVGDREQKQPTEATGWVGWVFFAALMMIMVGSFQVIAGLTALFKSGYYLVGEADLLVNADFTTWGWVHIGLGAVAVAAGVGLMAGQTWARVVGIAMALVSSIVNLAFISAYPIWSVVVITLDVFVIYAIAVHGKEVRAEGY